MSAHSDDDIRAPSSFPIAIYLGAEAYCYASDGSIILLSGDPDELERELVEGLEIGGVLVDLLPCHDRYSLPGWSFPPIAIGDRLPGPSELVTRSLERLCRLGIFYDPDPRQEIKDRDLAATLEWGVPVDDFVGWWAGAGARIGRKGSSGMMHWTRQTGMSV